MSRSYWGCEMESPIYREVVLEMKERREALLRQARGQQRVEDIISTKRGKRNTNI